MDTEAKECFRHPSIQEVQRRLFLDEKVPMAVARTLGISSLPAHPLRLLLYPRRNSL